MIIFALTFKMHVTKPNKNALLPEKQLIKSPHSHTPTQRSNQTQQEHRSKIYKSSERRVSNRDRLRTNISNLSSLLRNTFTSSQAADDKNRTHLHNCILTNRLSPPSFISSSKVLPRADREHTHCTSQIPAYKT